MKKYGFGIIGLGMIAKFHAKAIQKIENAELIAGFHPNFEKAQSFCAEHGGNPYSSLENFLANKDLDIVTLATPSGLHLDGAIPVLKAGKHVVIEKPLEITKERCLEIIKTAKENNRKLAGIFPSRYHKAAHLIKNAIDQGRFGVLTMADAQIKWFRSQKYYDSGAWRGTWKLDGGGALMNQSIHGIDLLQWFMGDVQEVTAYTATLAHKRIEVEDTASAILRFKNGALGVIQGTTAAYPGFLKKIEICGSKGSVTLEEDCIVHWNFADERPEDQKIIEKYSATSNGGGGASDPNSIGYEAHKRLFESFINALENDTPVDIDGLEATKSVEIIEAIYCSAREGKSVSLPL